MRQLMLLLFAMLLIAAKPAADAQKLLDQGREKDAFELLAKAEKSGDAEVLGFLAGFYEDGRVVTKDLPRAAALYRQAAEGGNRAAQWRLGVMLDLGIGTAENPDEAFLWLTKAAERGSPKGHASLGLMYAMGRGTPVNYVESMRHYREAAKLGEAHGFYGVGVLYDRGEGVPQNPAEAFAWTLVAALFKDRDANKIIQAGKFDALDGDAAARRANQILKEFNIPGTIQVRDPTPADEAPSSAPADARWRSRA